MSTGQLVLSGVFTGFRICGSFSAKTRLGWVPFGMEEADDWCERHRHWAVRLFHVKPLDRTPSEYARRHILFSVQHVERVAFELHHPLRTST